MNTQKNQKVKKMVNLYPLSHGLSSKMLPPPQIKINTIKKQLNTNKQINLIKIINRFKNQLILK